MTTNKRKLPTPVRCKYCPAKIIWIVDQAGTKVPVNYVRVRAYAQRAAGDWAFFTLDPGFETPALVHVSHFTTCPNASRASRST